MEYTVATSNTTKLLKEIVNKRLNEGWRCQGGITVAVTADGPIFYQALVYNKPEDLFNLASLNRAIKADEVTLRPHR